MRGSLFRLRSAFTPKPGLPRSFTVRHYLSATLYSQKESMVIFEPLSRAEDIINGLCRLKIGRLPATQKEREIVAKIRDRFDESKSEAFRTGRYLRSPCFFNFGSSKP